MRRLIKTRWRSLCIRIVDMINSTFENGAPRACARGTPFGCDIPSAEIAYSSTTLRSWSSASRDKSKTKPFLVFLLFLIFGGQLYAFDYKSDSIAIQTIFQANKLPCNDIPNLIKVRNNRVVELRLDSCDLSIIKIRHLVLKVQIYCIFHTKWEDLLSSIN